jgi:hypothetical protein
MFCPRCASHNIDDAKYCRVCGADISLLPQVLSGQLNAELSEADAPAAVDKKSKRRRKEKEKEKQEKPPPLEKAFENIGVGVSFLLISIMIAIFIPGGRFWWFWMLIPALACAGEGVGQLLRLRLQKTLGAGSVPPLPASRVDEEKYLPPRDTAEIMIPPPSITEHTTRHLNVEPPKPKLDKPAERPTSTLDSNPK